MSTSYIFLAGALFLFVIAIVILFMGKGKKDDKKVDKEFDENYAVNINEVYLRTGDVRETLVQMQDSYEDYNPLMSGLLGKAITYLDGDYGDSAELTSAFDKTIKNTLLTDYIQAASKDEHVKKFENSGVYAPENSVTLYKMLSSYLTIVPKEEIPIDMEKLNEAILGERGYYDMLLKTEKERKSILRFNLQAFKNNYNLVDLSKMKLTYFGIKVGTCGENHLSIDKEFDFQPAEDKTTAEEIVEGEKSVAEEEKELDVYDIVLAGVVREED